MHKIPTTAHIIRYDQAFETSYAEVKKETQSAKVVLVGGCFDLMHIGHVRFLQKARSAGDLLVVALESDEFIKRTKHRVPVHVQAMRAEILAANRFVDVVVTMPYLTSHDQYDAMVLTIAPQVIAITENDPATVHKDRQAKTLGAEVLPVIGLISNFSSTSILHEIVSRD